MRASWKFGKAREDKGKKIKRKEVRNTLAKKKRATFLKCRTQHKRKTARETLRESCWLCLVSHGDILWQLMQKNGAVLIGSIRVRWGPQGGFAVIPREKSGKKRRD